MQTGDPVSSQERRLSNKQKVLDAMLMQYDALTNDLIKARSESDKVVIEKSLKDLEIKIEIWEQEIQAMKGAAALKMDKQSPQVRQVIRECDRHWESKFHRIDFSQSRKTFEPILARLGNAGGATLLFLQKGATMGGKWCTQAIQDYLDRLALESVPPRAFTFSSIDDAEPEAFLNYLASKYELPPQEPAEALSAFVTRINQAIWASLYGGNIFVLKVQIECELDANNQFIQWFVDEFWQDLCLSLTPRQRIRLVGILSVDTEVPKASIEALRCTRSKFDQRKLLSLPLHKWKKAEICGWLIDHSGLMGPPASLSQQQLEKMAASIYARSESGQPALVYSRLMDEMSRSVG